MKINPNDPIYFDLLAIMRQRIAFVEMTIPEFTELNALPSCTGEPLTEDSEPSAHPETSPRPLCGELDIYFIKI